MLKRILVPVDGTEYSWRALEYACELVKLSGGSLVIMTVSSQKIKQHIFQLDTACGYTGIGDEVLDSVQAFMCGKNIDCMYLFENSSRVAESILRNAHKEQCDGIVLGSRGLGVFEGLLYNSVSQVVLESADVPVTIIK